MHDTCCGCCSTTFTTVEINAETGAVGAGQEGGEGAFQTYVYLWNSQAIIRTEAERQKKTWSSAA